jgi:hypothetical protein
MQQHIELFASDESVDRSAVERDARIERGLEQIDRNGDVLAHAEDVGEDQTDEANVVLASEFEDVPLGGRPPRFRSSRGVHRLLPPNEV